MTLTRTANALGNGPFEGFVPEALTTLFELRYSDMDDNEEGIYVVVSNLPGDDSFEPETSVFVTHKDGALDLDFYLSHNGSVMDLPGDIPAAEIIEAMGYEIIG